MWYNKNMATKQTANKNYLSLAGLGAAIIALFVFLFPLLPNSADNNQLWWLAITLVGMNFLIFTNYSLLPLHKEEKILLLWLTISLMSVISAENPFTAFWGSLDQTSLSWVGLALAINFFVITNRLKKGQQAKLTNLWLCAFALTLLITIGLKFWEIPALNQPSFRFTWAVLALSIYPLLAEKVIYSPPARYKRLFWETIFILVLIPINWGGLITISGWIILSGFIWWRNRKTIKLTPLSPLSNRTVKIILLNLLLGGIFLLLTHPPLPLILSWPTGLPIILKSWQNNFWTGVGLGEFNRVYLWLKSSPGPTIKHAPWIMQLFTTSGAIISLSYAAIWLYLVSLLIRRIKAVKRHWGAPLAALVALVIQLVYPLNFINLIFWGFVLAVSLNLKQPPTPPHNFGQSQFKKIIFSLGLLGWLIFLPWAMKWWVADILGTTNNEQYLHQATQINAYRYEYPLALARLYRYRTQQLLKNYPQKLKKINQNISQGAYWAHQAVMRNPWSVEAQKERALVYENIVPYALGAENWAIQSWQNALKLEPTNYYFAQRLGELYLKTKQPQKALPYLEKALALNSQDQAIKISVAKAWAQTNKTDAAIALLKKLGQNKAEPQIFYELGLLYYNQKRDLDQATKYFAKTIALDQNHANALYALGIIMREKGKKEMANQYFQRVFELNPSHLEIRLKLQDDK